MIWAIIAILVILWLFGFMTNVAGGLVHLLLVIALILLIYNLIMGRRVE